VLIPYDTEEQAIAMANDSIYGLNAGVAGADEEHCMAVAAQLRAGQVHVNTTDPNPLAPFGGYKQSGDGREWGLYGFEEFLQVQVGEHMCLSSVSCAIMHEISWNAKCMNPPGVLLECEVPERLV
jgi:hypothetical protein